MLCRTTAICKDSLVWLTRESNWWCAILSWNWIYIHGVKPLQQQSHVNQPKIIKHWLPWSLFGIACLTVPRVWLCQWMVARRCTVDLQPFGPVIFAKGFFLARGWFWFWTFILFIAHKRRAVQFSILYLFFSSFWSSFRLGHPPFKGEKAMEYR